jgi:hypothetical protein
MHFALLSEDGLGFMKYVSISYEFVHPTILLQIPYGQTIMLIISERGISNSIVSIA